MRPIDVISASAGPPADSQDSPGDSVLAGQARELLEKIASFPRFAGSESEKEARGLCASLLETQGMAVGEADFEFSELPGRYGVPFVALLWLLTALFTGHVFMRHGGAGPALAILGAGMVLSAAAGRWLAREGTARIPWMRARSANLVASRGRPEAWLIAHLDSKSQTIPMIARIVAILAAAAAFAVLAAALFLDWAGIVVVGSPGSPWSMPLIAAVAAATTIPVILCLVRNDSPGALDNASGVIAVVLAVTLLREHPAVGVILTSGEELGLAGARAYADTRSDRAIAVNCDTIDDTGRFLCMARRSSRGAATSAMMRAAVRTGVPVRVRGMLPGILADSIAFADAGWDSLSLSRGNIATLARVHTSSDSCNRLNGTGIAKAARLLAATVEELS